MKLPVRNRLVKLPLGCVSAAALDGVLDWVYAQYNVRLVIRDLEREGLQPYTWMVSGKGTYCGAFPKRLRKYLHKKLDISLNDEQTAIVGSIAAAGRWDMSEVLVRFCKKMGWRAGDYADRDSCFWTMRDHARQVLYDKGCKAMVVHHLDGKGLARCIAAPWEDGWVLFNAYGMDLERMAQLACLAMGSEMPDTCPVELACHGTTSGLIWINGSRGIYMAPQGSHMPQAINLQLGDWWRCTRCEDWYDNSLLEEGVQELGYCPKCILTRIPLCCSCGQRREVYTTIRTAINHMPICRSCFIEQAFVCTVCNRRMHNSRQHHSLVGEPGTGVCMTCQAAADRAHDEAHDEAHDGVQSAPGSRSS